jgi:hypothetical protein
MIEGRPRQSLVLYENPIEITGGMDPNDPFKKSFGGKCDSLEAIDSVSNWRKKLFLVGCVIFFILIRTSNKQVKFCNENFKLNETALLIGKKKGQLPPMESKPKQEEIVDAILPPREWIENGKD